MNMPPSVRLLVRASLLADFDLAKADGAKIANQPGYYFYAGRWHAIAKHGPAPKGAPVAHDHKAHAAAPAKHLDDAEWSALKLPDSNSNAPSYNKHLDKLKELSEGGHVGGILGMPFGTNTYGAKAAKVANHLLALHGSQHTVTPGQKAGEHAAVQAPAATQLDPKDKATIDGYAAAGDAESLEFMVGTVKNAAPDAAAYAEKKLAEVKASATEPSPAPTAPDALQMPAFREGKTTSGVKAYYEKVGAQLIAAAQAGSVAALQAVKDDALSKGLKSWNGKTSNSKKLLALHAAALAHAGGTASPPAAPQQPTKPEATSSTAAGPKTAQLGQYGDVLAGADGTPHKYPDYSVAKYVADLVRKGGTSVSGIADTGDGFVVMVRKKPAVLQPNTEPAPGPTAAADSVSQPNPEPSKLSQIPWDKQLLPDSNSNAKSHNAAVAKIKALAEAGDLKALEAIASAKSAAKQTYSKKQGLLAATAAAALKGGAAPAAPAAAPPAAAQPAAKPSQPTWSHDPKDAGFGGAPTLSMPVHDKLYYVAHTGPDGYQVGVIDADGNPEYHEDHVFASDAQAAIGKMLQPLGIDPPWVTQIDSLAGKAKAPAAPLPPKPNVSPSVTWQDAVDEIEAAIKTGDELKLDQMVSNTVGLGAPGAKAAHAYALAGLAHLGVAGPKDGDTKPSADGGTLVFKDGHWHKQPEAAPAPQPAAPAPTKKVQVPSSILHNTTDGHSKFWAISAHGNQVKTTYGKIGSKGQETVKTFGSPAEANAHYGKQLKSKFSGGYVSAGYGTHEHEVAAGAAPAAAPAPAPAAAVPMPPTFSADGGTPKWAANYDKVAAALYNKVSAEGAAGLKGVVTSHSDGRFSIKFAGFSLKKVGPNDPQEYRKQMHAYVTALKAAAGKAPKAKAAASAPPPAAPAPTPASAHPSMDSWVQTGPQAGSNAGGKFKDPSGQEWYCKFPGDDDTAKSEVLAAKLYAAAGLGAQDAMLVTKGGKIGIASKWVSVKKATPWVLASSVDAASGFAVDAWLANWDVVGLGYDNLQIGPDGKAVRVDAGGSLEYRAQGAKKPFGNKVDELDTLRDASKNPQSAAVFGKMTDADIAASVAKVAAVSDLQIRILVNQHGPGTPAEKEKLIATLIARKQDLLKKYPQAAKAKKKHVFKPEKISAPPSFLNWGGSGKPGPSSKDSVNQANDKAVQAIFAAAKTGSIDAVKAVHQPVLDKETGVVIGDKPVLEHPSQHVKGYAQQAINEIEYQLNPPKRFRFDDGHPLNALHAAYPSHPGPGTATSKAAQMLGKYLVIGDPGTIKLEDAGLPAKTKHSEGGGTMSKSTFASKAQAAFAKMPKTQLQAIQSYCGSGYHQINGSLWSGAPSAAAKAAGEGIKTLGHEIPPGTILSRKISVDSSVVQQLLNAKGKILQEPAVMSTSIRPSSWSGNVHLKIHVGPGVKGLWVGNGSQPGGGSVSPHSGEDEIVLPPNCRMLVLSSKVQAGSKDEDGFGGGYNPSNVVEVLLLPTQ